MKGCISCKEAMRQCMDTHTFAFAHLYNDEKAMDMHIHDCYEIYYSISGGKPVSYTHLTLPTKLEV